MSNKFLSTVAALVLTGNARTAKFSEGARRQEDSFTDAKWEAIVRSIADAYQMDEVKAAKLLRNRTARLIAAIPFVAGCDHPERTALSHLSTFVLASTESCRRVFDHEPADDTDPLARLAPIADFTGGDRAVIERGMRLLAVIMVNGYEKDLEKDKKSGEYNPVLAGAWKADEVRTRLFTGKQGQSTLDSVMPLIDALVSFWTED